jgi:hypothetical protein
MPARYNFDFKILTARFPFLKSPTGANLLKLIAVIRTALQAVTSAINDSLDARLINTASGSDLDRHGVTLDLARNDGEHDDDYRTRLLTDFQDIPTGLTVASIKNAVNQVLGYTPDIVEYYKSIWEWPDPDTVPTYSTFGNTSIGTLSEVRTTNIKTGCKFTLSSDSNVELRAITAYISAEGSGTRTIHSAIYADSTGAPGAKIADADHTVTVGEAGWYTFNFTDVQLTQNETFWLTIDIAGGSLRIYYEAGSTNQTANNTDAPPPNDPFGTPVYDNYELSIYASYHVFNWEKPFNSFDSRYYVAAIVTSEPNTSDMNQIVANIIAEKPAHNIVGIAQKMPDNYELYREIL